MDVKSSAAKQHFVPGSSRRREAAVTLHLKVANDRAQLLAMGERIHELRKARGLKQQTVADHCGVTLRTYQFWQQGKHPPEEEHLEKLAELFNVEPTFIMRGTTPEAPGDASQLDRIEQKLDRLLELREHAEERLAGMAPEDALDMLRDFEALLGRLGGNVGRRDAQSRRAKGRPPKAPPNAA